MIAEVAVDWQIFPGEVITVSGRIKRTVYPRFAVIFDLHVISYILLVYVRFSYT